MNKFGDAIQSLQENDDYDQVLKKFNERFSAHPSYAMEWLGRELMSAEHYHMLTVEWITNIEWFRDHSTLEALIDGLENFITRAHTDAQRKYFWVSESTNPMANIMHTCQAQAKMEFVNILSYVLRGLKRD